MMSKFDPIQQSVELAEASENALFGVARPQMTPERQRQADELRNIIRKYIKNVKLLQELHEADTQKAAKEGQG